MRQRVAAAARSEASIVEIARRIAQGFRFWIDARLAPDLGSDADREAAVAMVLAMIDGLALLRVCSGDDLTNRAGAAMGQLR